ncbi:MAG TPA: glycosyltransferase [Candidatus Saccharimonadales bacterium]|nr:glycosyltransferase [Candidatus Saccharimonadales bacterium]
MKNQRLAIISYHTCPLSDHSSREIGGMNTYVLELAKALSSQGYTIDIFTRMQDKNSPKIVDVSENLRVIHLPAGESISISKKKLIKYTEEFLRNFYEFVKEEELEYCLISSHYYLSGLIGLAIKAKFNIPLFVTFHTLGIMKNLVAREEEEREDVERIKIELSLVEKADKIIATGKRDAQYIEALYNCPKVKIATISPGVDFDVFHPLDKNEAKKHIQADMQDKLILFVGRLEPLKGIDTLLYAMKILLEKNLGFNVCLWIVGGDVSEDEKKWSKELKKLEQIRKLLHIGAVVRFVGKRQREDLPYYYNASEIVVLPSQYESFGITALEAMACATPVITTDVAGVSQLFDEKLATLITTANNPILLASKMKQLLVNDDEHKKISQEVFEKVQNLSWGHVAQNFIAILHECAMV